MEEWQDTHPLSPFRQGTTLLILTSIVEMGVFFNLHVLQIASVAKTKVTNTQTDKVTLSLLELLIAAKNTFEWFDYLKYMGFIFISVQKVQGQQVLLWNLSKLEIYRSGVKISFHLKNKWILWFFWFFWFFWFLDSLIPQCIKKSKTNWTDKQRKLNNQKIKLPGVPKKMIHKI